MYSITMQKHFNAIREILLEIGENVEGNMICDIHPDNIVSQVNQNKIHNLRHLANGKRRICEVGVNAGHSLLLMLDVNPTADYVLFDIGTHKYTRPCIEYIRSHYPNTSIQVFYGDSKVTLPKQHGEFDLIHIDGGHYPPEVMSDYKESMRLIAPKCPIVFDDYNFPYIQTFLTNKLQTKEIELIEDSNIRPTNQHIVFTNPWKA
jgi:predicted O-methyltransferase YrrM